jgi:phosphate starvation-inducible protein PhoH and related proteins
MPRSPDEAQSPQAAGPSAQADAAAPLLLEFENNRMLMQLLGEHDRHLALIEDRVGVACVARGNQIVITGAPAERQIAALVLRDLYRQIQAKRQVGRADVEGAIRMALGTISGERVYSVTDERVQVQLSRRRIAPRSPVQAHYIEALRRDDLVFGIGPAGTGKTYLAVAVAASMLAEGRVDRLVLSRPAVEAGERLGFLPGDMREKVDPYLRPLYDALHDMFTGDQIARKLESGEIEVAPLAFMRGRTLRNAYVILDEAQNCTPMQMKMFLTRLGENSRMAVTGDPTQIDLPQGQKSGLNEAIDILHGVEGISMLRFTDADVVRHPMVARIVRAYEARTTHEKR